MLRLRLASAGFLALVLAGGCCSLSERPLWSRLTRPRAEPMAEVSVSEGPVLDECTTPMPPSAPPGVMESTQQSLGKPRRLVPYPNAQDMPYSP